MEVEHQPTDWEFDSIVIVIYIDMNNKYWVSAGGNAEGGTPEGVTQSVPIVTVTKPGLLGWLLRRN